MLAAIVWGIFAYQSSGLLADDGSVAVRDFRLPTLEGEVKDIEVKGKRQILYFFAPWCGVCRHSMSNLQEFWQNNPDIDVKAIALSYESVEEVEDFVGQLSLTMPVLLGNEQVRQAFQVKGFPTYYVINESGQISGRSLGYSTKFGISLRSALSE